eukprot:TRINITY_DN270_c0_g1_i1.p1 TRINITY_DN270_c0_g1~~TRINITY_DN270_c0_g1_i1.p1  ORF type:complete len:405 (-),score=150.21 TRINITY_DN270_c0_g1_i1:69-1235(-)
MRTGLSCLLLASLIQAGLAVKFSGEKVKLGKAKCTCDFNIKPGPPCGGTAKCDKKCSGKGSVSVEGFEFNLQCKKGKCSISGCQAEAEPPVGSGSEPGTTGSGPEPLPITGSGSGEMPVPMTGSGSGSGPEPLPITGSGSGPVPLPITGSGSGPNMGEGMKCSCNCDCPDGGSNCECACNCPVKAKSIVCESGFTKVCPMMYETMCPDMMVAVCPDMPMTMGMEQTRKGENRMSHVGDSNCQCVPDFLLAMVPGMPGPGDMVAGRSGMTKAPVKATIQFGKTKCKCTVDCKCAKGSCAKTKISCDKKCSGTAKNVEIKGCGVIDAKAAKGKVKISKCTCGGEEPTGTGSGSGPVTLPITGSGSGPMPPTGSGSEPPMGSGPKCACVGI